MSEWISVKERLPETEQGVLVTVITYKGKKVIPALYEDGTVRE